MAVSKAAKVAKKPKREQAKAVKDATTPAPKKTPRTKREQMKLLAAQLASHHGQVVRLIDDMNTICPHRLHDGAIQDAHGFLKKITAIAKDYERSQKA
jgi:hypothetical protein